MDKVGPMVTGVRWRHDGIDIDLDEPIDPASLDASKIRMNLFDMGEFGVARVIDEGRGIKVDFVPEWFRLRSDRTYELRIEQGAFVDISIRSNELEETYVNQFTFEPRYDYVWSFDRPPEDWALFGNAEWRPSGGVGDSGYIKLTDGLRGQSGAMKLIAGRGLTE